MEVSIDGTKVVLRLLSFWPISDDTPLSRHPQEEANTHFNGVWFQDIQGFKAGVQRLGLKFCNIKHHYQRPEVCHGWSVSHRGPDLYV